VRFATVTGTVVDAVTDEPLPNVDGGMFSPEYRPFRTDANGRFSLGDVRQYQNPPTPISVGTNQTVTHWYSGVGVNLAAGATSLDLKIPMLRRCAAASVVGKVVAEGTLAPIAGATVAGGGFGQPSTTTATDGTFSLTFPIETPNNDPYLIGLTAAAPGFNPSSRNITIFCGAQLVVDFAPPPPGYGTVTGVVRDDTGAPAADIFVGGSWGNSTRTATDGTYTLTGAPSNPDGTARNWLVTAVPPATSPLLPASVPISVAADATVQANLDLTLRDVAPPPNRAPVARITPASPSTPEGTPITLSASTSSDPDGDTLSYAWDIDGDGFDDGGSATLTVAAPRAATGDVRVRVSDPKGLSNIATVSLVITNVAPTVDAGDNTTVGPSGVLNRPARSFTDPGDGDAFTATVDWGEGGGAEELSLFARSFNLAHTFAGPGTFTVVVRVCDSFGGCGEDRFDVTVSADPLPNVPPTARVSGPSQGITGRQITFDASASFDPDGTSVTYAWDTDADGSFDDGSGPTVTFAPVATGSISVVVLVSDPDGASATASTVVRIRSTILGLDQLPDQRVAAGTAISLRAVVRDESFAASGYTATVDWGDGRGALPAAFAPTSSALALEGPGVVGLMTVGSVDLLNSYGTPGTYTVVTTVCGSACTSMSFVVVVTDAAGGPTTDLVTTIAWPATAPPGISVDAVVTVRNRGADAAVPVVVLALTGNAIIESIGGEGWTCDLPTRCTRGTALPSGQSSSFTVRLAVPSTTTGALGLVAATSSTITDDTPSDNVARASLIVVAAPAPPILPAIPPVPAAPPPPAAPPVAPSPPVVPAGGLPATGSSPAAGLGLATFTMLVGALLIAVATTRRRGRWIMRR
jgi:hypothetical protein